MKLEFFKIAGQLIRLLAYSFNNIISDLGNNSTVIKHNKQTEILISMKSI